MWLGEVTLYTCCGESRQDERAGKEERKKRREEGKRWSSNGVQSWSRFSSVTHADEVALQGRVVVMEVHTIHNATWLTYSLQPNLLVFF